MAAFNALHVEFIVSGKTVHDAKCNPVYYIDVTNTQSTPSIELPGSPKAGSPKAIVPPPAAAHNFRADTPMPATPPSTPSSEVAMINAGPYAAAVAVVNNNMPISPFADAAMHAAPLAAEAPMRAASPPPAAPSEPARPAAYALTAATNTTDPRPTYGPAKICDKVVIDGQVYFETGRYNRVTRKYVYSYEAPELCQGYEYYTTFVTAPPAAYFDEATEAIDVDDE